MYLQNLIQLNLIEWTPSIRDIFEGRSFQGAPKRAEKIGAGWHLKAEKRSDVGKHV